MKRHVTRLHCVPKYLFGGIRNTTGYNACYGPVVDKNAQREAEDIKYKSMDCRLHQLLSQEQHFNYKYRTSYLCSN